MKKEAKPFVLFLSFLLTGCMPAAESAVRVSASQESASSTDAPSESHLSQESFDPLAAPTRLTLSCSNNTNTSCATFEAQYSEKGITVTSHLYDSDLYARNIYDIGYDDNIEFNLGVSSGSSTWQVGKTFHFLMNGNGRIYFQAANSRNSFGPSLDKTLHAVLGENLIYTYERFSAETSEIDGFKCTVFFAYDVLNTSFDEAYGNISVCPAMRNTHIYSTDTAWASYGEKGCKWDSPSSYVLIDENGCFSHLE